MENDDKRTNAPNTVYFRQAIFLLNCPWTWLSVNLTLLLEIMHCERNLQRLFIIHLLAD